MYSGVPATIPLGQLGIVSDRSPTELPAGSLLYAKNVTLFNGSAEKAPGGLRYNATPLSAGIVAGFDWWPDPSKQRLIVVTSDGKTFRDEQSGSFAAGVPGTTGLGVLTPNCRLVEGGNETGGAVKKLFLYTHGANQLKVLVNDESTFRTITLPATDWKSGSYPNVGVIHRGRQFAFAGQQFYASDSGDHENFQTNSLFGTIFPGEGGELRGAHVFKGRLFAWKDGGFVYYYNDLDTDSDNWYWQKLSSNSGLSGTNAVCEVINDMWTGNTSGGITSFAATQAFGDMTAADVLKQLEVAKYVRNHTNASGLTEQHALYYPEKKQAFFTYRSTYRPTNDMLICIDMNAQNGRMTFLQKGSPQCMFLRKDVNQVQRPCYGDASGYVIIMDREDRLEGGSAYTGGFQTPHMDFRFLDQSLAVKAKNFHYVSVTYGPESSGNLSCDYFIDGKYMDTITFPMVQYKSPELGTFLLNTDRLASTGEQESSPQRIRGFGRTLSLYFYNSGANESFRVTSITVGFKPAGEEAQKATGD